MCLPDPVCVDCNGAGYSGDGDCVSDCPCTYMPIVAALFVETDGVYCGLPGVHPWTLDRDARAYKGPHPVVAHPPVFSLVPARLHHPEALRLQGG